MGDKCAHMPKSAGARPERTDLCEKCIVEGSRWVNLRYCLKCGNVGCCDSSPKRHARKHFESTKHAVIGPVVGEDWVYCFIDDEDRP